MWDERSPSINLPSATALSSSWDVTLAGRYGATLALEARRKGVDVVLGPTINLQRSPLAGRHFEAFSEDPLLTAELAAAYVEGVQRNGVGATPKHYVANDFETERHTVDVRVGDRALRELYLLAFEKAVVASRAWLVMSAYNSINGTTATEHDLLETPLSSEWGFDGVVVSDWTAVRSIAAAHQSQDLAMPGPDGPWGEALVEAVRSGAIAEEHIDRKVRRILLLAARVGALTGFEHAATAPIDTEEAVAFAREAAVEGFVLVRNHGLLPLAPTAVSSVAVIGHNARHPRTQGGGSATVIPASVSSPLDGIRAAFPHADVTYAVGAVVQEGVVELDPTAMRNPVTGGPGAHVRFLGADGEAIHAEDRFASTLVYFAGDTPVAEAAVIELTTQYTPDVTGPLLIGFAGVGTGRILVDGTLLDELAPVSTSNDPGAALLAPPSASTVVDVVAGRPIELCVSFAPQRNPDSSRHAVSLTVGVEADQSDPAALIAEAVETAKEADVAIVVVGTNSRVESEGRDRTTLALPGAQDDLVRAVVAANARTVVVVNAGSPVEMPWDNDATAILLTHFGGQEYGNALADVLVGDREPGGRLPTTWPSAKADVPVIDVTPRNGVLSYDEGIHIGYRAWLRADRRPAHSFGSGLGYTTWSLGSVTVTPDTTGWILDVPTTNTGLRVGKQVVQVYAARSGSSVDRPVRWLVGFGVVRTDAGATAQARVRVPRRALAHWDDGWCYEPGTFTLHVGTSVVDLPLAVEVELSLSDPIPTRGRSTGP